MGKAIVKCSAQTRQGNQCKREAVQSGLCGQHWLMAPESRRRLSVEERLNFNYPMRNMMHVHEGIVLQPNGELSGVCKLCGIGYDG